VADIERAAGTLRQDERRAGFAADKWDVYAQFARLELARGRPDSAFELSEQLRARQLLDLMSRGRVTPWQTNPGNAAQIAQEQDYRRQITLLMRRLEGPSTGLRGPLSSDSSTAAAREALARVQQAYADLLRQVQSDQPNYAALVTARVAPAREVQAALPSDVALLEYLVSDSTSLVFVATSDTVAAVELGVGQHELAKLVEFTRGVLTPQSTLWRAPLQRLYRYLIEPVAASGLLAGKHGLIIAPHGELHYVPFAALLDSARYLIERYRLTTVPSASVWLRLKKREGGTQNGGHVLALAPQVSALPGSQAEVAAIRRLYDDSAGVLQGAAASKRALRDAAPQQRIIHFATYGVLNKDNPLFSFVELKPANGDDGRLEVHEVFGLDLRARLVVLSACQTGLAAGALADVPTGDDWLGLVEAFHFAGAAKVMATLWPVEDRATADLMAQFYAALKAGRSEAEALAEAQRATLRKRATSHPLFWAGFTLSGDL
jgi:CHAT domain-containing protein